MGIMDWAFNKLAGELASRLNNITPRVEAGVKARSYRMGQQKRQLRVKDGQFDDNITLNFSNLIMSRIVSSVLGEGIEFRIDGAKQKGDVAADPAKVAAQSFLDMFWDANKKEILLHRGVLSAAEAGTGYFLINPPDVGIKGEDGNMYPRLTLIDPLFVEIHSKPEDWEIVTAWVIEYNFKGVDGKIRTRRRTIQIDPERSTPDATKYLVIDEEQGPASSQWFVTDETQWAYDWPPIIHWQSNPSTNSQYGEPDISVTFEALQDRVNFVASNISKIVRLYAHPQTIFQNAQLATYIDPDTGKPTNRIEMGPDKAINITGPDATAFNLAQLNDLTSSINYLTILRQTLFDTSRVVDIDSIQDKIGALTNFGLRVLYQDQLAMVGIKRELLGDCLEEINRRVLEMAGMPGIKTEVIWPETMPVNQSELADYYTKLEAMKVIDRQTIAEELGLNWDSIMERLNSDQQNSDNVGAALLNAFNRGGGATGFGNMQTPTTTQTTQEQRQ